jgi:hypothetical protein
VVVPSTQTTVPARLLEMLDAGGDPAAGGPPAISPQLQMSRAGIPGGSSALQSLRVAADWRWHSGARSALVVPDASADGRLSVYPTTFFPGVRTVNDAQTIVLASGDERAGTNFEMRLVPTAPATGIVVGPEGPVAGLPVKLLQDYQQQLSTDTGFEAAVSITDAMGRFQFLGVPSGDYWLRAVAGANGAIGAGASPTTFRGLYAEMPVVIADGAA